MADDKIKSGTAVVDQNTGTSRGTYVGKASTAGQSAAGDGSMSTALQHLGDEKPAPPEESLGDAAKRLRAAKYENVKRAPMGGLEYAGDNIADEQTSRQREMFNTKARGDAAVAKGAKPAAKTPSYKKGTMRVPKTGPAKLHKGEMVVPAKKASAIRSQVQKVKKAKASMPMKKSMAPLMGDVDKDGM